MTKIAVFDSGIGGTTVLERVRERAPWADLIYVADHVFGPYGERTLEEVRNRTELLGRYLQSAGVAEIVIACNSASAAALHELRDLLPDIAFVGMEPAVKPAAEMTKSGTVAVLATGATFQGELFRSLVGRHGVGIDVIEQACPGLAAAVEQGEPVGPLLDAYLPPIAESDADVVVLGCTHYPLIRREIEERLPGLTVVDPSDAVAKQAISVAHDIGIDLKGMAATEWWTTALQPAHLDDRGWQAIDILEGATAAVRIGDTTIAAVQGDITTMPVDVVVNAANTELAHGGGIALAISDAGGRTIDEESTAWIETYGPLVPGVAALTSSGRMPSSYVAHVAGPVYQSGQENEELLAAAVFAALDTATEIEASSIALPAISAGVYGYPADEAARVIAQAAAAYLDSEDTSLRVVRLVGYGSDIASLFGSALDSMFVDG